MAFGENCMCISERRLEECMSYLSSIKNDDNNDFIATAMCCVTKELCRVRDLEVIIAPKYYFKDSDVKETKSRRDISFRDWLRKETESNWWKVGCSKGNI